MRRVAVIASASGNGKTTVGRTLADRLGVPVVLAKLVSDVCVFTFGQLLLLRFFVFPARRTLEAMARARAPHWDVPDASLESPVARTG